MKLILILIGVFLGVFCGLIPGVHPNTAGAVLADVLGEGEGLAIILIGVLGAYTAISFLPAIFLGIPEGDTIIALLPGQRMMKEGRAREAIFVVAVSLCVSALLAIVIVFLFGAQFAGIFGWIRPYTGYILILFSFLLLFRERTVRRIVFATLVFFLAGILGYLALESHMRQPLFSLFVGFFAIPALLLHKDYQMKKTRGVGIDYSFSYFPHILVGIILGAVADFLPGISTPSQLAVFGSLIERNISARNFLAQIASIEASHCIFSISSASLVGIARVGAVAISSDAYTFGAGNMMLFLGIFLACLGMGALFILRLGGLFERIMDGIKFEPVAKLICIYLLFLAFFFEGTFGVLVLFVAALIGFLPIFWKVSRTHVMGSIILVSILRAFLG